MVLDQNGANLVGFQAKVRSDLDGRGALLVAVHDVHLLVEAVLQEAQGFRVFQGGDICEGGGGGVGLLVHGWGFCTPWAGRGIFEVGGCGYL